MSETPCDSPEIDLFFESRLFKILGEPIRVEIIRFLAIHGVSDVGTVAQAFPQDRSVISRHLRLMSEYGILHRKKVGRSTFYGLNGFEFLHSFEAATEMVRRVLAKICPAQFEAYERTGTIPQNDDW